MSDFCFGIARSACRCRPLSCKDEAGPSCKTIFQRHNYMYVISAISGMVFLCRISLSFSLFEDPAQNCCMLSSARPHRGTACNHRTSWILVRWEEFLFQLSFCSHICAMVSQAVDPTQKRAPNHGPLLDVACGLCIRCGALHIATIAIGTRLSAGGEVQR